MQEPSSNFLGLPFGWGAIGSLINIASTIGVGAIIIAWLKSRIENRRVDLDGDKQASEERAADFERLRSEITAARDEARASIAEAKAEVRQAKEEAKEANATAKRLDHMINCLQPALTILTGEIIRLDPNAQNNVALKQAQDLVAMAATGDFGVRSGLMAMVTMKGVGE